MDHIPKTLAIDFGTKRIGLALSYGTLAEPFKVLSNTPEVFREIQTLLEEEGVQQIIVGISENEMAELTRHFVTELQKLIDLPLEFRDETLSSYEVGEKLKQTKKHFLNKKGPIDHYAAAEFLQAYLDEYFFHLKK